MTTPQQLAMIEQQLGRKPRGLVAVSHQTESGVPVVLQMRSIVDGDPFPTLFWLSSRDLYRAIARLETEGWVKRLEEELQDDENLRQAYQQNHRDYVALRWQLMSDEDRKEIERKGFSPLFERYGIGGIAQWDKVRCLHMHYADYLCADYLCAGDRAANVIGERLEREFQLRDLSLSL